MNNCAAQHFGHWLAHPRWLASASAAYNAGTMPRHADPEPAAYEIHEGIAVIDIMGQITKGRSSFGGTSAIETRQFVRQADRDTRVQGIMLHVDSPGGTVAGLKPLADEVARASKPTRTHADDMMASAALWVGSQAGFVTASEMTEVGSIGVVAVVEDSSGMAAQMGVKVHVISTGDMKGAFAPGTEVTPEMIAEVQGRVDEINEFFMSALRNGRGLSDDAVRAMADGRDWLAGKAQGMGLIDAVSTFEDAMSGFAADLYREKDKKKSSLTRRAMLARLR